MKTTTLGAALLLVASNECLATSAHRQAHRDFEKRHGHGHSHLHVREPDSSLMSPVVQDVNVKRAGTCSLPTDDSNLVAITDTRNDNNGFAMSPDEPCKDGMYCPIACKPGMLMNQWRPNTSYVVSESMDGGLYCNGGVAQKPFPDRPNCVEGTGTVTAVNKCGKVVSFCQTVLPGNENMLIKTEVAGSQVLAVPGPDYWAGTAAHYYVNPPGVSADEACHWGSDAKNIGNWSPFVAGANTDASGSTFVQLSWNPIYQDSKWANVKPDFGVRIECNGNCNGLPCEIDPSKTGLKGVNSLNAASGAGGASFCVVTVAKGSSANIVVFNTDGSTGTTSSSSSQPASTSSSSTSTTAASSTALSSTEATSSTWSSSSALIVVPTARPGIFQENSTSTYFASQSLRPSTTSFTQSSAAGSATSPSSTSDGSNRDKGGAAVAGLVIALIAAAWMF